jgi:hypothetical protein
LGDDFGRDEGEATAPGQLGQRPARLPPEFDPSQTPRVRVQATRLRQALTDYYRGPGADDGVAIDLAGGDATAAARSLEEISTRVDPVVQTIRAAVACRLGDVGAAREFADETLDLCEEFPRFREIMMRRFFPGRVVDAVARALEPLALGWFHDPPAEDA